MKVLAERVQKFFRTVGNAIRNASWRRICAYVLMVAFILLTAIGAGLIFMPAGFIAGGVASGLVGYLLGAD